MVQTAREVISKFFPRLNYEKFFLSEDYNLEYECVKVPLSYYGVENPKGYDISGAEVWVPKASMGNLKGRVVFKINGDSPKCVFLILKTLSGKATFYVKGARSKVLLLSNYKMSFSASLIGRSCLVIGESSFIASARITLMNTDFRVGAGALWSDEILIQGADQHGIIDLVTGKVINDRPNKISIGRHVWVGRRAIITKNIQIGDGSIVGTAALVTKDVPPISAVGGVPAKVIRKNVSWTNLMSGESEKEEPLISELKALVKVDGPNVEKRFLFSRRASSGREWAKTLLRRFRLRRRS